eukprot:COSAG06_NODE_65_length_26676_cov_11.671107_6_plen_196_part_00
MREWAVMAMEVGRITCWRTTVACYSHCCSNHHSCRTTGKQTRCTWVDHRRTKCTRRARARRGRGRPAGAYSTCTCINCGARFRRQRLRLSQEQARTTIKAKNLDLHYESVTFGTFGSFGTGTWRIITKACDPATHPGAPGDSNPWNAPGPKRDFILSLGFALQRANSRMLRCADRRRRNARGRGLYSSGTRPTTA